MGRCLNYLNFFSISLYALLIGVLNVFAVRIISFVFPVQAFSLIAFVTIISILSGGIGTVISGKFRINKIFFIIATILSILIFFFYVFEGDVIFSKHWVFYISVVFISALPFLFLGCLVGSVYKDITEKDKNSLKFIVFFSTVFFGFSYVLTAYFSDVIGLVNIVAVASFFLISLIFVLAGRSKHAFLAFIVLFTVLILFPFEKKFSEYVSPRFSVWMSHEKYEHVSGHWSPYARVDFIKYKNGDYIGGVYNGKQQWIVSSDPDKDFDIRTHLYGKMTGNVLLVGAGGGYGVMNLSNADEISAVELDPLVLSVMKNELSNFNSNIYNKVNSFSGDGRTFIERSRQMYDVIIYEGTDITVSNHNHSFINMENYLYTKEGLHSAFKKIKEDGILFVAHTRHPVPSQKLIKGLPEDVYYKVWYGTAGGVIDFPYIGIIASRSLEKLSYWERTIEDSGIKVDSDVENIESGNFTGIHIANVFPITDNNPFLYFEHFEQANPLLFFLVFILLVMGIFLLKRKGRKESLYFFSIGAGYTIFQLLIIAKFGSVLGGYVQTSALSISLFSIAVGLGNLLYDRFNLKVLLKFFMAASFVSYVILFLLNSARFGFFSAVFFIFMSVFPVGISMGYFFPKGLSFTEESSCVKMVAVDTIGGALGTVVFFVAALFFGFQGAFVCFFMMYILAMFLIKHSF